ncbi:hypothetical protein NDU88_005633 [Pleurodeles waltl]|uniref:Uncharacterized protein n=1 Tax=Pleurodeles waltl TaxID=8319 RepID=A0AAV7SM64_PLEWA|nr:hypothetical protein NDU88_005633 [Pleurodeles waltl]
MTPTSVDGRNKHRRLIQPDKSDGARGAARRRSTTVEHFHSSSTTCTEKLTTAKEVGGRNLDITGRHG